MTIRWNTNQRSRAITLSGVIFTSISSSGAMGASDEGDGWHFKLIPLYLWGAGLSGTSVTPTRLGPVPAPIDVSFKDALSNLEAAFTFHFEAGKGQWTLLADYSRVDLGPEAKLPNGRAIRADVSNEIVELGGLYQLLRTKQYSLELLAGARYTSLEEQFGIEGGPQLADVDESWWDGFGGGRVQYFLNESWTLLARGDAGAGGSNRVWNVLLGIDWRFQNWGSVIAGYRWLDYDYETGSGQNRFTYDVLTQGPIGGLALYW